MFNASVGDDVFGEDPTVNELEAYAAELFGKEAGLYCSSGTQTNQIAINVYCRPGDEVICSKEAHIYKYEGGGIAKNSGSSVKLLEGDRGRINALDVKSAINDPTNVHYPITALVALEDTMNRGGGAIYSIEEIKRIKALCETEGLPLHLDGARVFNALVETGIDYKTYGGYFDSISICLSKGLGAPVGSVLVGNKDFIQRARRVRKVYGGGMRQAGIIAAGGLFALKNNINLLKEDHRRAKELEKVLNDCHWVESVLDVQTNIVVATLNHDVSVEQMVNQLADKGILVMPFGGQSIRMVTHLDINHTHLEEIIAAFKSLK
jgi:threonine aldolase